MRTVDAHYCFLDNLCNYSRIADIGSLKRINGKSMPSGAELSNNLYESYRKNDAVNNNIQFDAQSVISGRHSGT